MHNALKMIILCVIQLIINHNILSQKGFQLIRKAETAYEHNCHTKALRLLNKAQKMNYGFCGNAWIEAFDLIYELRSKIYTDKKQYDKALSCLDSVAWSPDIENTNTLRFQIFKAVNSNIVSQKTLENALNKAFLKEENYNTFIILPFGDNLFLKLKIDEMVYSIYESDDLDEKKKIWLTEFKKSALYKKMKNL